MFCVEDTASKSLARERAPGVFGPAQRFKNMPCILHQSLNLVAGGGTHLAVSSVEGYQAPLLLRDQQNTVCAGGSSDKQCCFLCSAINPCSRLAEAELGLIIKWQIFPNDTSNIKLHASVQIQHAF